MFGTMEKECYRKESIHTENIISGKINNTVNCLGKGQDMSTINVWKSLEGGQLYRGFHEYVISVKPF